MNEVKRVEGTLLLISPHTPTKESSFLSDKRVDYFITRVLLMWVQIFNICEARILIIIVFPWLSAIFMQH